MEQSLLIPSSILEEKEDPRIRAYKLGQIARTASIFRVTCVVVYHDEPDATEEICQVLRYAATPPYLRKEVFDKSPHLRYVGVIPPLRIPPHEVESTPQESQYREGVVTKVESDGRAWVNCGLQHPVTLHTNEKTVGERVTLRISSTEPLSVEEAGSDEPPHYWGYKVESASLTEWLDGYDGRKVATSRMGDTFTPGHVENADEIAYVFGSPSRGIKEILRDQYSDNPGFDSVVNTIPNQGTRTVRTEEAVLATLAQTNNIQKE